MNPNRPPVICPPSEGQRWIHHWPTQVGIYAALVALTAAARLVPHPPNFTPVAALALFAGVHCRSRMMAIFCPLVAMLASDLWIGFAPPLATIAVYACFAGFATIGVMLRGTSGGWRRTLGVGAASLAASTIFFLATNLAVWAGSGFYDRSAAGLAHCYAVAIPFYGYTIAGDLTFCAVLFGGLAMLQVLLPARGPAVAETL